MKLLQNRELNVIDTLCALMVYPVTTACVNLCFDDVMPMCIQPEGQSVRRTGAAERGARGRPECHPLSGPL